MSTHATAEVSAQAQIGPGTQVWHHAQIRERARVGANCIIGKGAYIDSDVQVGSNVKIQNGAFLYHGCTIEDGVFIGPGVCFTNDKRPRAINADGTLKSADDWEVGPILVRSGASLGCGSIVLPNVTIGRFAMVGAGTVVSSDVPDYGLVLGVPSRLVGFVCACGEKLVDRLQPANVACPRCTKQYSITSDAQGLGCRLVGG